MINVIYIILNIKNIDYKKTYKTQIKQMTKILQINNKIISSHNLIQKYLKLAISGIIT